MNRPTSKEIDELIQRTLDGERAARERLFGEIQRFVKDMRLRQLGPYSHDPDCIAEICARLVDRFIAHDYKRLRAYLARPERCFWSWLQIVATRVAIDLARSMQQNIASRSEGQFRWIVEVELVDPEEVDDPNPTSRLSLLDVYRYLYVQADPRDVEMLQQTVQSPKSWHDIGQPHDLKPHAARQRIRRLRQSLRQWVQRQEPGARGQE